MPRTTQSASAYSEEYAVWEQAMLHTGFILEMGTTSKAIRMVQRLNQARIAMRKLAYEKHKATPKGERNTPLRAVWEEEVRTMEAQQCEADDYTIKRPDNGTTIHIVMRERLFDKAYTLEGKEIDMPRAWGRVLRSERMLEDGRLTADDRGHPIPGAKRIPTGNVFYDNDGRLTERGASDIGLDPEQPLGLDVGEKK